MIININVMAFDDTSVTVRYYPPGQPLKELTLKDISKIKKIDTYWKGYKNFPDEESIAFRSKGFFQLVYFYPNGDCSYNIVITNGILEIDRMEEPKVFRDTKYFYKFLMEEKNRNLPKCYDPILKIIYSINSGMPNPTWNVCDTNSLKQYLSYIESLEPASDIRSCGFESFMVYPAHLFWDKREIYVCESGVSQFRPSHREKVKDIHNLYQYLTTEFLDELIVKTESK